MGESGEDSEPSESCLFLFLPDKSSSWMEGEAAVEVRGEKEVLGAIFLEEGRSKRLLENKEEEKDKRQQMKNKKGEG